jgi:hypothetical protein
MHTFTIFGLIINTTNSIVHSNTKFVVISYNQNLQFKIQCRKIQKQNYNLFHHILILQKYSDNNMNIKITIEINVPLYY